MTTPATWPELRRLLKAGYELRDRGAGGRACDAWLNAWSLLLEAMTEKGLGRLAQIDRALEARAPVSAWVSDFHESLWNEGLKEGRFLDEGVRFTSEFLSRFEGDDDDLDGDMRCALACFHAQLGRFETADELFRSWLTTDPTWGLGWLRWAECYSFRPWENERLATRGVEILREGCAVPGVHALKHLLADLEGLLADLGRYQESRAVRRQLFALATEAEEPGDQPRPVCNLPSWLEADRLILDGYERWDTGDKTGARRLWLEAWPSFLQAMAEGGVDDIDDFDDHVSGYGYVPSWLSSLAIGVSDVAQGDRQSLDAGMAFTTEFLRRFDTPEGYATADVRRAHGLLHARAGRFGDADALFRRWLSQDPGWGWGWIDWSACYTYGAPDAMIDDDRSIEILEEGAAVPGLRDARDLLQELAEQLAFVGRAQAAAAVLRRLAELPPEEPDDEEGTQGAPPGPTSPARTASPASPAAPAGPDGITSELGPLCVEKIGRNQPCPCGSGKKFKKCCRP